MFLTNLNIVTKNATNLFGSKFLLMEITPERYTHMKYPRAIPIMHLEARQYVAKGFGNLMTLDARGIFGKMELSTMVFTPSEGLGVPVLLVDTMIMPKKGKAVCFVEFYDCTKYGVLREKEFYDLAKKYEKYPDYEEKPAWYISRRAPYSFVKSDIPKKEGHSLPYMIRDTINMYGNYAKDAAKSQENLAGLQKFQKRMVTEGNPSSPILEKLFGKKGAAEFFRSVIMPIPVNDEGQ